MAAIWGGALRLQPPYRGAETQRTGMKPKSLVPGEGIEPTLCCQNRILSPARLPVPPARPGANYRPNRGDSDAAKSDTVAAAFRRG